MAGAYPAARYARAMRGSVTVHVAAAADVPVLDGRRFRRGRTNMNGMRVTLEKMKAVVETAGRSR